MQKSDRFHKYKDLRKQFKKLYYESYELRRHSDSLEIAFNFNLDNIHYFRPSYRIPIKPVVHPENFSDQDLDNIIFNIGMIELVSYWKAACPQTVIIRPFALSEDQKEFWKNLYFQGLGEFFYLNSIQALQEDFMHIVSESDRFLQKKSFKLSDANIIPVGGGKDSVVSIQLLSEIIEKNLLLILNPRKACTDTAIMAGYSDEQVVVVHRSIDPVLLKLNDEGFLNGHTPFSALLAFVSLLVSVLTGHKNILLSNESSANESTVGGTNVNHQYSKSIEFERDFRDYVSRNISADFNYFSFLRPINELQIARLFSEYGQFHQIFRSCNAGSKTDRWCGCCPKCLFIAIILSPFMEVAALYKIFGKDILNDEKLLMTFRQLYGAEETKPFECVGTIDDVNIALCMAVPKFRNELPFLLNYYIGTPEYEKFKTENPSILLKQFSNDHFLQKSFETLLKAKIHD